MLDVIGRDDHYYRVTVALTARELHTRTYRSIAVMIATMGVAPAVSVFVGYPPGPTLTDRVVGVAIAVTCAVMSACWLRGWPSRRTSQLCVVVGTACIAVSALLAPSPMVGLVVTTAFAVVSGHVAIFHSLWLLAVVLASGAAVLWALASQLAQTDGALAIIVAAAVSMIVAFAVSHCLFVVRLIDSRSGHGSVDRLTGLLTRDGFLEQVSTLISARSRGDDRHLVMVVVNVDNWSLVTAVRGQCVADRVRVAVAECLRENARRDAVLARPGDCEFYVADLFTTADATPLIERLRSAVATTPFRLSASIGVTSTPLRPLAAVPHYDVIDELLAVATTAMYDARRSGGNATRQIIGPPLAASDPDQYGDGDHDVA